MIDINPFKKTFDARHLVHEDFKFAAMDWDRTWWVFTHKPTCVDDMWDSKEGRSEKIVDRAVETTDLRSSLVELETYIED